MSVSGLVVIVARRDSAIESNREKKQWKNDQSKWLFKIYENTALLHSLNENDDVDGGDYSREKEKEQRRAENATYNQNKKNERSSICFTSFLCVCAREALNVLTILASHSICVSLLWLEFIHISIVFDVISVRFCLRFFSHFILCSVRFHFNFHFRSHTWRNFVIKVCWLL